MSASFRAPVPDLRIVPGESLHAHETHDSQRSRPLIDRFRSDKYIINPPVVAPMDALSYVILDGANRCHALGALGYPHIPVQVVNWESDQVTLDTWNHVVSGWNVPELLAGLDALPGLELQIGPQSRPVADLHLADGRQLSLVTAAQDPHSRNALLCQIVAVYQTNATLYRSIIEDSVQVREYFPDMVALLRFPRLKPADIVAAAREKAWIPPGISRHIIRGRALQIHYPMRQLEDDGHSLEQKNAELHAWLQQKLAQRQVRFYAESTYLFDE